MLKVRICTGMLRAVGRCAKMCGSQPAVSDFNAQKNISATTSVKCTTYKYMLKHQSLLPAEASLEAQ